MLLARPVLEEWQAIQDYANGKLRLGEDGKWIEPDKTKNGHYLLKLVNTPTTDEEQAYMTQEFEELYVETPVLMQPGEHPDDLLDYNVDISPSEIYIDQAECAAVLESFKEAMDAAQEHRKKAFWELYVDRGNLSQEVAQTAPGIEVSTFSLPEWDLDKKSTQETFVNLMKRVAPSHLWLAPPCTLWSPTQELNSRDEMKAQELLRKRQKLVKEQMTFVKQILELAVEIGAYITIEHPERSLMWKTKPFEEMEGYYDVSLDRCRTGLVSRSSDGSVIGPVRKRTRLRTTSLRMAEALDLQCRCLEPHVQMIGRAKELKGMQNYERGFVKLAAAAIRSDVEEIWAKREMANIMTMEDLPQPVADQQHSVEFLNKDLVRKLGRNAVLTVSKLHRQLGHPGRDRLEQAAKDSRLGPQIIQARRAFRCAVCESHMTSQTARTTTINVAQTFNQLLLLDAFYVKWR